MGTAINEVFVYLLLKVVDYQLIKKLSSLIKKCSMLYLKRLDFQFYSMCTASHPDLNSAVRGGEQIQLFNRVF